MKRRTWNKVPYIEKKHIWTQEGSRKQDDEVHNLVLNTVVKGRD